MLAMMVVRGFNQLLMAMHHIITIIITIIIAIVTVIRKDAVCMHCCTLQCWLV